jgi:hypothetical protein
LRAPHMYESEPASTRFMRKLLVIMVMEAVVTEPFKLSNKAFCASDI